VNENKPKKQPAKIVEPDEEPAPTELPDRPPRVAPEEPKPADDKTDTLPGLPPR
jgi:hypothetical protein